MPRCGKYFQRHRQVRSRACPTYRRHTFPGSSHGGEEIYFPVILNRVVPHEAHLPLMAWRPFLKVTVFGEAISLVIFSFTQKALVTTWRTSFG